MMRNGKGSNREATMGRDKAVAWVEQILSEGGDPTGYRKGIAQSAGVDVSVVDEIIAKAGEPSDICAAEVADIRARDPRTHETPSGIWDD
jgi:hypothetical protein